VRASVDVNDVGPELNCRACSANQVEWALYEIPTRHENPARYANQLNGRHLFLKDCAMCGSDFYGTEKQTHCDECADKRRTRHS
jgi:hypothetical protein